MSDRHAHWRSSSASFSSYGPATMSSSSARVEGVRCWRDSSLTEIMLSSGTMPEEARDSGLSFILEFGRVRNRYTRYVGVTLASVLLAQPFDDRDSKTYIERDNKNNV